MIKYLKLPIVGIKNDNTKHIVGVKDVESGVGDYTSEYIQNEEKYIEEIIVSRMNWAPFSYVFFQEFSLRELRCNDVIALDTQNEIYLVDKRESYTHLLPLFNIEDKSYINTEMLTSDTKMCILKPKLVKAT